MFDIDNIATLSGLNKNTVRTLLPDALRTIKDYTHKSFITDVSISDNIVISDGKIILSDDVPNTFIIDSQIELRYSLNNTRIYTIKSINNNKIETYEKLFDEEFTGFIIKLSFDNIGNDVLASMISYKNSAITHTGVKSESVDGYTYTLNTDSTVNGYPLDIMSSFNSIRQLAGNEKLEYYNMGYYIEQ